MVVVLVNHPSNGSKKQLASPRVSTGARSHVAKLSVSSSYGSLGGNDCAIVMHGSEFGVVGSKFIFSRHFSSCRVRLVTSCDICPPCKKILNPERNSFLQTDLVPPYDFCPLRK